ncbi:MAG: hypothetical protein KC425_01290, partial [Anaerolineales bacterium]|nr:hypothetical protein [Anaerolineales bacterium]
LGQALYLDELDDALETIRGRTGIDQFALIGMDACLMGHVEVFAALAPHTQYGVASQEVEPALGWAYTSFLDALVRNPDMSPAQLAQGIVDTYIDEDQRIVDDQQRAEMLNRGSPMGGLFDLLLGGGGGGATMSAAQLAAQMGQNVTLTAVDLSQMPLLLDSLNSLALALQNADQPGVARARTYAQSFTSVFGSSVPPSYIDLGHFAQLLQQQAGGGVAAAAGDVLAAIETAVVAEKHGPQRPGATGISVYFPNSELYRNPATGPQSYTVIARRFAEASLWDDFLAFHYAGRGFEASARETAVPAAEAITRAPGAEAISVTPLQLSAAEVGPGETILMSTDITGQNIGYIYLFAGFVDQAANAIFVADSDYLESADTRELNGIFYPVWPEGETFTFEFAWEPVVFAISDGTTSEVALFSPETYGESFEEATYTVDGIYTYADGGEQRYARLLFQNGLLRQVLGFNNGESETGAPREIIPQSGDQFTILERWMDLDSSGGVMQVATQEGGTLTFGDQPFVWETLDAAAGTYVIGFIVSDLDGNRYPVYETVTVR